MDGVLTAYTWVNSSTIRISPAPANTKPVVISRETPFTAALSWADGAMIRGKDLNKVSLQALYVAEEASDKVGLAELGTGNIAAALDAATSAAAAAVSQTAAAASQTAAAGSASSASTSAATVTTQASAALASSTSATASALAASNDLADFELQWLGVKTADPTLNNSGGALSTGQFYFNSVSNTLRIYNSAGAWQLATIPSNLSTVASTVGNDSTAAIGSTLAEALQFLERRKAFDNLISRNATFDIWQRGASIVLGASTTAYAPDGWFLQTDATMTSLNAIREANLSFQFPVERNRNTLRLLASYGASATTFRLCYPLDELEVARTYGARLAFTLPVNTPSNKNMTVSATLYRAPGSASKRGATPWAGEEAHTLLAPTNLGFGVGGYVKLTGLVQIPDTAQAKAELQIVFTIAAGQDPSANIYVQGAALEVIGDADPATYRPEISYSNFTDDLIRCQRHYCKTFDYAVAPAQNAGFAGALGTRAAATIINAVWRFPIEMRATPVITTFNPSAANANWTTSTTTPVAAVNSTGTAGTEIQGTGATDQGIYRIHVTADASI